MDMTPDERAMMARLGKQGGKSTSDAKRKAAQANVRKAQEARKAKADRELIVIPEEDTE